MEQLIDFHAPEVQAVLDTLLKDRSTGKNIIWATDPPEELQTVMYEPVTDRSQITTQQLGLTHYEVELPQGWQTVETPVQFPACGGKTPAWVQYVQSRRLEVTCGEAPFLASRYDAATGEMIPVARRIGILDRKLRVVSENAATEDEWRKYATHAVQSTYGYEYQGDNLLVARINLLMTFVDYMQERWRREPTAKELNRIANVISWNIWQMDGLKGTIPGKELYISDDYEQLSLFASDFEQETLFDEAAKQNKKYECKIRDWRAMRTITYNKMKGEK